ncbi:hypothetical protein GW943_02220 [Candidatus Parcubacteria bacterium]|uniref:Uncharacterized protein n=1 Tax=Candidatus Kaiserbacteria bacterium CG10_big_fil_rev_8_21_14_0_10_47_16 TaxID=1974608 RepID=A0A2H0UFH8_9BACT|nr:hypothetical protein [Candidatus Parcubacteria bacterium]PIR84545.1 MAG: hypothetical protein COU16_03130 [Candidatus Kaiserbacteria bacterium CG10_big_fil_rev_8_21_14_0_10_47_16]
MSINVEEVTDVMELLQQSGWELVNTEDWTMPVARQLIHQSKTLSITSEIRESEENILFYTEITFVMKDEQGKSVDLAYFLRDLIQEYLLLVVTSNVSEETVAYQLIGIWEIPLFLQEKADPADVTVFCEHRSREISNSAYAFAPLMERYMGTSMEGDAFLEEGERLVRTLFEGTESKHLS